MEMNSKALAQAFICEGFNLSNRRMKSENDQKITIGTGSFIRISEAVVRHIAGEHLLIPFRRGKMLDAESVYILDEVGAWVWEALAEAQSLEALEAGVREAFDVFEGQDVAGDLRELLEDLMSQDLVSIGGVP